MWLVYTQICSEGLPTMSAAAPSIPVVPSTSVKCLKGFYDIRRRAIAGLLLKSGITFYMADILFAATVIDKDIPGLGPCLHSIHFLFDKAPDIVDGKPLY